ncbi:MAG: ABC transporter ATP-binding protein [Desulfobacteraceae bacterium]|nr:ABC transporter ATP-binding protein [Desulfobacteraceae bacterium]
MTDHRLSATDISVEFSGLRALDHVTLDIGKSEIVGLIGPNGSGKTTLINVITGQVHPVSGSVSVNGNEITRMLPRKIALKGITRSFQIVRLFDNLTVVKNVETTALAKGASRKAATALGLDLLAEFGLSDFADQLAGTLSYGDKRKVEIVRALAGEPHFLLLDEPAAGLNEAESETLLSILSELPHRKNLGMLIIDHDMTLIMRLCHRLHVLSSGKTIGQGDVDDVRNLPEVIDAYLGTGESEGVENA